MSTLLQCRGYGDSKENQPAIIRLLNNILTSTSFAVGSAYLLLLKSDAMRELFVFYFLALEATPPTPLKYLKNSELGSTTIKSCRFLKLAR